MPLFPAGLGLEEGIDTELLHYCATCLLLKEGTTVSWMRHTSLDLITGHQESEIIGLNRRFIFGYNVGFERRELKLEGTFYEPEPLSRAADPLIFIEEVTYRTFFDKLMSGSFRKTSTDILAMGHSRSFHVYEPGSWITRLQDRSPVYDIGSRKHP